MSEALHAEITAAEARRCAAMVANDPAALADCLDDGLQFHHATGAVDDKTTFLAKMAAGRIRYCAISWSEEKVVPLADNAALLTGRMITDVQVEGTDKRLNNRVMTVWRKGARALQLVAFQSTPIAG